MRKFLIFTALLSLTFLLACGDTQTEENEESEEIPPFEITDAEKVEPDEVVMNLNGQEVTGERYNLAYLQIKAQLYQFGQDVSDVEEIKEYAIEALVEQEILQQDAMEKGIEVAEADVDEEMDLIKSESKESFEAYLETYKFDENSYKMMLSVAMLFDKYKKDQFSNIEVSDEEVEEAYEELKNEDVDVGELEEVRDSLHDGLVRQKENEKIQERIELLKDKADIEMNI